MPPRKIFKIRCSEIASESVFGSKTDCNCIIMIIIYCVESVKSTYKCLAASCLQASQNRQRYEVVSS